MSPKGDFTYFYPVGIWPFPEENVVYFNQGYCSFLLVKYFLKATLSPIETGFFYPGKVQSSRGIEITLQIDLKKTLIESYSS